MKKNVVKNIIISIALLILCCPCFASATETNEGESQIPQVSNSKIEFSLVNYQVKGSASPGDKVTVEFTLKKDGKFALDQNQVYIQWQNDENISLSGTSEKTKVTGFDKDTITFTADFDVSPDADRKSVV